ncbi:hypothetical protein [Streptomyces sp. NPDC059874]|uniref:hypothetical protein n=1 Tax=Streptomyces sp. NPDC059874 TaxID=3346983 RepID=UPI00365FCBD0
MFDHSPDLELHGIAYVDGAPLECGHCGNAIGLHVHKRGPREVWPAWITCGSCGRGDDSATVTNGLVDAVLAARTGRQKAEDRDLFTAEWREVVMTGELRPTLVMDDLVTVAEALRDEVEKDVGRWWGGKKKAAKAKVAEAKATAKGAVKDAASDAATAAKGAAKNAKNATAAAVLTTAWQLQTQGAGPAKMPKAKRCTVKGCRGGMVTLATRLHSPTGKSAEVKIPCGTCHRTGR